MNEPRKSDSPIVPMKAPNKAGQPAAEAVEGRGLAKGNPPQQNAPRTQCRPGASSALERVRQAVAQDGTYPCCAQSWRHHLRQEPDAVVPHVRIRGGGHGQPWSLLRPHGPSSFSWFSYAVVTRLYEPMSDCYKRRSLLVPLLRISHTQSSVIFQYFDGNRRRGACWQLSARALVHLVPIAPPVGNAPACPERL